MSPSPLRSQCCREPSYTVCEQPVAASLRRASSRPARTIPPILCLPRLCMNERMLSVSSAVPLWLCPAERAGPPRGPSVGFVTEASLSPGRSVQESDPPHSAAHQPIPARGRAVVRGGQHRGVAAPPGRPPPPRRLHAPTAAAAPCARRRRKRRPPQTRRGSPAPGWRRAPHPTRRRVARAAPLAAAAAGTRAPPAAPPGRPSTVLPVCLAPSLPDLGRP
mmetsp:Transcript_12903/g.38023  ORF Transcript_12903/g.38023 Transcript_12903/m.38023 type:complete len:220 (+) Transcript_12903:350-1009(+)